MKMLLAGAAFTIFAVGGANATIYQQTFSGIVVSYPDGTGGETAEDYDNLFGGGSLLGDSFTATFLWDDTVGVLTNDATTRELGGGTDFGVPPTASPNLLTTLTINGHSFSYVASNFGYLYTRESASGSEVNNLTYIDGHQMAFSLASPGNSAFAAPSWNFSGSLPPLSSNSGFFWTNDEEIPLFVTSYSIAPLSNGAAVPEPASWAMCIGGFGLIGGVMRRKKRAVSFA
jgi:hypothetical protein